MTTSAPRMGSIKNKIVASDLEEERKKCNFDQAELTRFIWGGEKEYQRVVEIRADMESDQRLLGTEKYYDMTREEQQENLLMRMRVIYDKFNHKYFKNFHSHFIPWYSINFQGLPAFGLTFNMFYSSVFNLGAEDQVADWIPKIRDFKMTGCYAQTELGHGSYVPGIETTAIFDKEKQEFIINSPTITSIKFWPGDMSKFSNHAIVFAKLILDGKPAGVHAFMMQTRDLQTWEPLPGIEMGDIGPKFGYNSKDNGYMLFKNVRVPRKNMMRRYVEVDENGQLQLKGDLRTLYGIMLETRVWISGYCSMQLAQGITIAGRYAVVRRQFSTQEGTKQERKLMDYQTHQYKFAPLLAYAYAMGVASRYLFSEYANLIQELKNSEFGRLDMLHHLSAGFKAAFSRIAYDGIDSCRQACGGAGFSAHSGLPLLQADFAPNTTYEGDNTVMLQQSARLLMKTWKKIHTKGEKATGLLSYLNDVQSLLSSKSEIKTAEDALCLNKLEKALAVRSAYKIKRTMEQILQKTSEGVSENERIHSLFAVDIVSMAQTHIMYVMFMLFRKTIEDPTTFKCPNIRANLLNLARILALYELTTNDSASVYDSGHFGMGTAPILNQALKNLLVLTRPQLIPLIEAFEFRDTQLVSCIGNSYGDIYETQLEWARNSRLNKTPLPKGFKEYMLPILQGKL